MNLNNVTYDHLKQTMKASAELEAELNKDESSRCYSFNSAWSEGVELAQYENGSGDDLIILFYGNNIIVKGFDHESEVSPYAQKSYGVWPGIYEGLPEELSILLHDKALMKEHVTFCYWLLDGDKEWNQGAVNYKNGEDDGSDWLLDMIHFNSFQFKSWAQEYYEEDAKRLESINIGKAFCENVNDAYRSVYYCTYQNGEAVESSSPIQVSKLEMYRLSGNVVSGVENFIGFVDKANTTLQFYSNKNDTILVDIPMIADQGSQVGEVSCSGFCKLVNDLEQPFLNYIEKLNLKFQVW